MVHPMLKHVIVDGSNIATEGRDIPSLSQLDEAVQAFIREYEPEIVTVVVDATFPNRIARNERKVFEDAIVAGEVITPPAGAIGRGDAFVLQIADRSGATVLSNDSFQEFHGLYDWLFDEGRLIGGKPVPHVGWVFMPRTPVRGPASRRAISAARRAEAQPVVVVPEAPSAREAPAVADEPARAPRSAKATKAAKPAKATKPAKPAKAAKARKATKKAAAATTATRRGRRSAGARDELTVSSSDQAPEVEPAAATVAESPAEEAAAAVVAASDELAAAPPADVPQLPAPTMPAAYNEALPFIEFVRDHPVGSEVDAVVEHFGSHGAYLRIGEVRAYVPLKNLADPAPRSAKEVVRSGEARRFVVAAIDPPRRGVDLAVPGVLPELAAAATASAPPAQGAAKKATAAKAKKTAAKKASRPRKRAGSS